ncbi:MAG: F0F1 ATP synthase subunit A [Chloroflexi bacterium]|nr:F0F1 ATP synthase subunit A [Chloroflexota bacterium]
MANLSGKQLAGLLVALLVAGLFVRGPLPEILVPAEAIASVAGFTLTNTILATWVTMLALLLAFRAATSDMQLIPQGLQNLLETAVDGLHGFVASVAGERYAHHFFPMVATIFLFVITNAWLSLLPGFGTIGLIHHADHGGVTLTQAGPLALIVSGAQKVEPNAHLPEGTPVGVLVPLLRGANTDLNTTLALALIAMTFVELWGIRANGFFGYGSKFVNLGRVFRGEIAFGLIDVFVGILEAISEIARVVSFTFRLFGNMFAGEVLLAVIVFLIPWALVLVFYGLELFVGFVQALVFAGLTLVFATMAVAGHGEGHESGAEHH